MSGLFTSGGQITGASASVLPMNVQDITIGFRIAFRIGWFNLLAVQKTLKTLLQYHNSKASILQCSALFMVQISHLYITTGKTITLTDGPLSANSCLCFLIHCLGLSKLFFQGANPVSLLMLKRLKLKLQSFGHLMRRAASLAKTLMLGKIEDRRRRG